MRGHRSIALGLALVSLLVVTSVVSAQSINVIKNGSFEEGFSNGVALHWAAFNNGGDVAYGFLDDTWDPVVFDGDHSQMINIHTNGVGGNAPDRYAGIYQVVDVVPNARYMFSFYGLVRSTEGTQDESGWNYRVEVGFDDEGGTDPWAVTNWTEMSWPEHPALKPGHFNSYARGVTTTSDKLTVFIRAWKKFPTRNETATINLDAVSLVGPAPTQAKGSAVSKPVASQLQAEEAPQEAAQPQTEPRQQLLPQTGIGLLLPFVGLILSGVAIALTSRRVLRASDR